MRNGVGTSAASAARGRRAAPGWWPRQRSARARSRSPEELREAVQAREDGLAGLGGHAKDPAWAAGCPRGVEPLLLGRREEDGDRDRFGIAPGLLQPLAQ